jgi:hypothetical protein
LDEVLDQIVGFRRFIDRNSALGGRVSRVEMIELGEQSVATRKADTQQARAATKEVLSR